MVFTSPQERGFSNIPEFVEFEDIVPEPAKGKIGAADKLIQVARGYQLNDMHDITREILNMSKYVDFAQTDNPELLMPQLAFQVEYENAPEIMRMLSAGTIVSLALLLNPEFKVHWDSQFEKEGLFGETWANGYYHFRRANVDPMVYADMIEVYWNQLVQVNTFFANQHELYTKILDLLRKPPEE